MTESNASPHNSWLAMGPNSRSGNCMARSIVRERPVSTMRQLGLPSGSIESLPTNSLPTSSMGRWVADSPMRTMGFSAKAQSRSTDRDRWEPRLSSAMACISSSIKVWTPARPCRPLREVNRMYKDSGVVIRICGGRLAILARSEALVSPVRTTALISGSGVPAASASSAISSNGVARFFWMSFESALRGDT